MNVVRKKAVNVSLDADLVAQAQSYGIGLSQTLDEALREKVQRCRAEEWKLVNREAIEAQNAELAEHGLWSEGVRVW